MTADSRLLRSQKINIPWHYGYGWTVFHDI